MRIAHIRTYIYIYELASARVFDTINILQISFNYLCPFKNYLGILALSKPPA